MAINIVQLCVLLFVVIRKLIMSKSTASRLDTHEAVCEERWKETIFRIKRLETLVLGSGGTIIVMLIGIIFKG